MNIRYFEKRPGAWHLDFRGPDGVRYRPFGGTTEEAARKREKEIVFASLQKSQECNRSKPATVAPVGGPTMQDAFDLGMKVREKWMQAKDKDAIKIVFEQCCAGPKLTKDSPVGILTRDFVRDLRGDWMQEPGKRKGTTLSASTINHRLSMLSVLLEVTDMPPHTVKHLSTKGTARHRRITDTEWATMQQWAEEQVTLGRSGAAVFLKVMVLGWETGARLSELLGFHKMDAVNQTMTFRATKNGLTRTIPVSLRAWKILEAEPMYGQPFVSLTVDRVTELWRLMRLSMGLQDDTLFVFHLLRHERASRFGDAGYGAHFIKSMLGHENIKTSESYVNNSVEGLARQLRMKEFEQKMLVEFHQNDATGCGTDAIVER